MHVFVGNAMLSDVHYFTFAGKFNMFNNICGYVFSGMCKLHGVWNVCAKGDGILRGQKDIF